MLRQKVCYLLPKECNKTQCEICSGSDMLSLVSFAKDRDGHNTNAIFFEVKNYFAMAIPRPKISYSMIHKASLDNRWCFPFAKKKG